MLFLKKLLKLFLYILLIFLIFILLFFFIIEKTTLFKKIYNPGLEDFSKNEKFYIDQGFSSIKYNKIIFESENINQNKFEDYYYVSPEITKNNELINIVDYYNSRKVNYISKIENAKEIIWFFGGSTMLQLGTEDKLTTPSILAKQLQKDNVKVFIANFGMSGFNSTLERIKFFELLNKVPKNTYPDRVIFYHGLNDMIYSYHYKSPSIMPYYMTKGIKMIVNQDDSRLLFYSLERIFWKSASVLKYLLNIGNTLFIKEGGVSVQKESKQNMHLKESSNYLLKNQTIINSTCNELNIKCYFVLQPSLLTKTNPSYLEKELLVDIDERFIDFHKNYYGLIRLAKKDYFFLDLSDTFNNNNKTDFVDWIHPFQSSNEHIGEEIYNKIFK